MAIVLSGDTRCVPNLILNYFAQINSVFFDSYALIQILIDQISSMEKSKSDFILSFYFSSQKIIKADFS